VGVYVSSKTCYGGEWEPLVTRNSFVADLELPMDYFSGSECDEEIEMSRCLLHGKSAVKWSSPCIMGSPSMAMRLIAGNKVRVFEPVCMS
jgi:hypothetical protein